MQFIATDRWKQIYPGAVVGILEMLNVTNPETHPAVEALKRTKEDELRTRFAGKDRAALRQIPENQAYEAYYKTFGKTYHVLLQLESIALKSKPFASTGALVQVMFVAEVCNLLLTAGHDLDCMSDPLTLDIAEGTKTYMLYHGKEQAPKKGDMMITDAQGITSSVILGPDQRTRIHAGTKNVLFAAYAPVNIGKAAVQKHLEDIRDSVLLFAPNAKIQQITIVEA